jgi:hypothetical protein
VVRGVGLVMARGGKSWTSSRVVGVLRVAGSVVVAAAADGASHPSHHQQYQADDEEDDPDNQANMGVGEGRDEGREEESEDDKDDSEDDHDVYLSFGIRWVVQKYAEKLGTEGQCLKASFSLAPACLVLPLI